MPRATPCDELGNAPRRSRTDHRERLAFYNGVMLSPEALAQLVRTVTLERTGERALDALALAALKITASRNVIIGRVDERGYVDLMHGAGLDWTEETRETLKVADKSGGGIIAFVAAKGGTFVTGDVHNEPRYRDQFSSTQSEVAVPVHDHHGRIRAVVNLESDRPNAYDREHVLLCETIADLVSVVIEREDIERREEALIQIGSALDSALSGEELIERVLQVAGDVLRFQSCSIFLFDPERELFMLRGSVGTLKSQVGGVGYRAGEGCTGWVCQAGLPLRLDDPQSDPRWKGSVLEFPKEQIAAYLAVPILYRSRSIGAIRVLRRASDNPYLDNRFTEDDERLLVAISEQVATGLENIRSLQKAIRVEQMAAWGELSAKSSHMIGNRVFALKGDVNELGHLLEERSVDWGAVRDLQKSLGTNVTRIEEILQEFRDFLTATQLRFSEANVNEIVEETVREVFPKRSEIALHLDLDRSLPTIKVDATKLRRAISELIENSLLWFEQGHLRVATLFAGDQHLRRTSLSSGRRYVAIEVADQGPGIDEERKQLIFRPFYSSRVKGMGLGLSIVKGIVDAHGGAIYEDGAIGEGAHFVILLPIEPAG